MKQNQNPSSPLPIVQMKRICKSFGRVQVLKDVELVIFPPNEVHVVAGENGAGKSTLIKILAGVYPDFEGEIEIEGKTVHPHSPQEATALGIAVIHQELSLVPSMSVADNIFLGRSITRHGFVQDTLQKAEARRVLDQLGLDLEVDLPLDTYPIAIQQLVEVAKAMSIQAKVIIMDEPTSALNAPEVRKLFRLITELKAKGYGIVYITHRMEEIEEIADRISVLRDGQYIGSAPAAELPIPKLIQWMVGRAMEQHFPRHLPRVGDDRLRVEEFSVTPQHGGKSLVKKVSFSVCAGEILGIGGLRGSGASELLLGLFGAYGHAAQGRVKLNGLSLQICAPRQAIDHGIALLTNDRKATASCPLMSVIANVTLADLNRPSPRGWRQVERERGNCRTRTGIESLRRLLDMEVNELSGGNQQKVVLAKWLQTNPQLLLLDESTRGVDVAPNMKFINS